ncbi:NosD domain-containing protein [Methanogenium organophilum]|uniref:Right-handed parallel beta-helix repeat-containing protein n=1 Tax=Methanogenium organophilum TaxID=2199 RepID=A0A9X9S513_METOG|nr:NosD domain-containing protein [Methanogenium organophilum]WAI01801.1 right-handed parallel beta-helix repeat-containing protein [Methanogenium organophilum]
MIKPTKVVATVLMIAYCTLLLVGCVAGDTMQSSPPAQVNLGMISAAGSLQIPSAGDAIPFTAPGIIDSPGQYLLTNNLTNASVDTGLWIQSSDVFLDGGGHILDGVLTQNTTGILAQNRTTGLSNITITNLSVSGWGAGIWITDVEGAALWEVRALGNQGGFGIADSPNATIRDCTVTDNVPLADGGVFFGGNGITVTNSPNTQVLNTNVSHNGWGEELPSVGGTGILSHGNSGLIVSGCTMNGNVNTGLWNENSNDSQVQGNQIHNNEGNGGVFMTGSVLHPAMNGSITANTISGSEWGIWIMRNDYYVADNTVSTCGYGILIDTSQNATLTGNVMHDNDLNFCVDGNQYENYLHQVDTSNTVDGKPVSYLVNVSGAVVDSAINAGTVYGINATDLVIRDLSLEKNENGIFLLSSDGASIQNVIAEQNTNGFVLLGSDDVRIETSAASDNTQNGILIEDSDRVRIVGTDALLNRGPEGAGTGIAAEDCWDLSLQAVNASRNNFAGIDVEESSLVQLVNVTADDNGVVGLILGGNSFTVTGCSVRGNGDVGIGMYDTTNATFWNNYFFNEMNVDLTQGLVTGSFWNVSKTPGPNIVNGPFIGGNYWAKPDGTGWSQITPDRGDGFCNASRVIDTYNTDFLPLTYYVSPDPVANFTAEPVTGTAPLRVGFTDTSTGNITNWSWSFGDGLTSVLQNPEHIYETAGRYSVTLNVTGPTGYNELIRADLITVIPSADDGDDSGLGARSYDDVGALMTTAKGYVVAPVDVEADDAIGKLTVPRGVVALDEDGERLSEVGITAVAAPSPGRRTSYSLAGYAYACEPDGATFSPAIDLIFTFTEGEWAALMATGQPLVVMYYNEESGSYENVVTTVDAAKRTVTAQVTHFSIFALMQQVAPDTGPTVPATTTPVATPTESPVTPVPPLPTTAVPTATQSGMDFPVVGMLLMVAVLAVAGGLFRRR